jgi:hypothetical protein
MAALMRRAGIKTETSILHRAGWVRGSDLVRIRMARV